MFPRFLIPWGEGRSKNPGNDEQRIKQISKKIFKYVMRSELIMALALKVDS